MDPDFIVRDLTYLAKDVLLAMELGFTVRNLTYLANEILLAMGKGYASCKEPWFIVQIN